MKKTSFIIALCWCFTHIMAQVESDFFEQNDAFKSFPSLNEASKANTPVKKMGKVNIARLMKEDQQLRGIGLDMPLRFGEGFDVKYTLDDGVWEKRDTAMVWNLKIVSPGAYSLNFIFDRMILPKGAQLYIFNPDGSMVYGPVTSEQNLPEGSTFLTDLVVGDEAVLQLFVPHNTKGKTVLSISRVIHAYINLFSSNSKGLGSSEICNNNVVCYPEWQDESDAVALVLLSSGTELCSGSLLNNTAQNYRPFFLTAFHCIDINSNDTFDESEISNAENWAFRFRYKKLTCTGTTVTSTVTYNRATFRAAWKNTDFALMELKSPVLGNEKITLLGWDRSTTIPTSGAGIHHPSGDVMKISFENDQFSTTTWYGQNDYWLLYFDSGVVEHYSSGSPLFNQNKKVVGQLSGNKEYNSSQSYCNQPRAEYGRFNLSWDGGGTNATRLSNWLDPNNTGAITTNTIRTPTISGSSDICAASFGTFTVSNAPEGFTWGSSSNLTKTASGSTYADFSVSGYSDAAWVSINLNGMEVARHHLVVVFDAPVVAEITGPENISTYGFYTAVFSSISPATYCDWATYNSYAHVNGNGYSYIYINYDGYYYPSAFTLLLIATNACGEGLGSKGISATGYGSSYVSSYPNPVSDILQIEIDRQTIARSEALRQTTTDGKSLKADPTYDVRLYDGQGNLLRRTATKGGSVEFNVANLPNGVYYLHIYDGTGNKPEMRQIVVEH